MIATLVNVWVIPDKIEDFIEACRLNHLESVKEPGNIRFDVLQDSEDPAKFTLYEAYTSEEASKAHKDTNHYREWRDKVASWMDKPRMGVKHALLYPLKQDI